MIKKIITNKNTGESVIGFFEEKVENVNPVAYIQGLELFKRISIHKELFLKKNPQLIDSFDENQLKKALIPEVKEFFKEIESEAVHPNFLKLLSVTKKSEQVKLLKGLTLTSSQLAVLIFKSYREFGFLYSKYSFKVVPPQFAGKKLPILFNINDDGSVKKFGTTDLSDGSLKQLIEQRTVIVSHFFEKDGVWHCFFATYDSFAGRENYKDGQAHMHYISSGFGISKDDFLASMQSGNYRSTNIHIDLLDYGNQSSATNV
ncbi:hypothetical protein D3C87_1146920 [compost metagenome]